MLTYFGNGRKLRIRWQTLNHRRFLLRCLSKDINTVSIRFESNIKTPKGNHIIKKGERALLNERIRLINITTNMFVTKGETYIDQLKGIFEKETMEECEKFINMKRESRQRKTPECQRLKFERLCQKNNICKDGCSNIEHKDGHSNILHGDHTLTSNQTEPYENHMRTIKEALYIRVNNPSFNRNIGKYHLPHIWHEVQFNTSELKLK